MIPKNLEMIKKILKNVSKAAVRATQIKKFFKQGMAVPQDMADGTSISWSKCYLNKKFGEKALPMVKIDFETMEAETFNQARKPPTIWTDDPTKEQREQQKKNLANKKQKKDKL
uniref:Uncharacterized protein n=1 Tax=Romanomermis culicivorax TaxID=13658 RepID=A0A915LAQ8_ROMCU